MRHHDHHGTRGFEGDDGAGQAGLTGRIEVGVGLIQDHQRGPATERPGQADALDLTTGQRQRLAQTADPGAVTIGQPQDHLVHAGQVGGRHHIIIGEGCVKAGDIVAQRAGQKIDLLRQIADPAAQGRRLPLIAGGPVKPDLAAIRAGGPGQKPGEGGFAGTGGTDHPHRIAGGQIKADAVQETRAVDGGGNSCGRLARPQRQQFDQPLDADLAAGFGQSHHAALLRLIAKKPLQTAVRFQRLADRAPLADHLIHRTQSPAGQDRGGDDHAARHLALDHQIGAQGQDGRLHQHPEGAAGGADHLARVARALTGGQPGIMQRPPAGADRGLHPHRGDHVGAALAALGKIAGHGIVGQAAGEQALAQVMAEPRQACDNRRARNRQPTQPRVDHEQHAQIQRHPRQIEQAGHRRPGQKAAQRVDLAQGLGFGGAGALTRQSRLKRLRAKDAIQAQGKA